MIGKLEACRLYWKLVISPITHEVFDQVVIQGTEKLFLTCESVLKSYEQNVQFIKEVRRNQKKKMVDRSQEVNFPTEYYKWPLEDHQERQEIIKFKRFIHKKLESMSIQECNTFMAKVKSLE